MSSHPEMFVTTNPKARKDYKCCECRCGIKKGQAYQNCAGKWDGDFLSFKTCIPCADLREKLMDMLDYDDEMPYGALRDDEYAGAEIRKREAAFAAANANTGGNGH